MGERLLEEKDIWFVYGEASARGEASVRGASLSLAPGEIVALVGPNGCGKSTLSRVLVGSSVAQRGSVFVDGGVPGEGPGGFAVGYVRQDPKSQLVAPTVFDEVAFGPCNLGLPAETVRSRAREALGRVGLSGYEGRLTETLSGGEQQRLALAGVLAMRPRYLVLDETTSMLDGAARGRVRQLVRELAASGMGVLLVTHCADDVLVADRVLAMNAGRIVWEGAPGEAVIKRGIGGGSEGVQSGTGSRRFSGEVADTSPASRAAACGNGSDHAPSEPRAGLSACPISETTAARLVASGVNVAFDGRGLLSRVSLEVAAGEVLLVTGPSGSGKTTLARVLSGVLKPDGGEVRVGGGKRPLEPVRPGMVGLCLQRSEDQFLRATVLEDVAFAPEHAGMSREVAREVARGVLTKLGVPQRLWESSVYALSGGEARLVGIAGAMAQDVPVMVFDEPTAGLDGRAALRVCEAVRALADEGRAVVVVSHELGEWLAVADRAALLHKGELVWNGPAHELIDEVAEGRAAEPLGAALGLCGAAAAGDPFDKSAISETLLSRAGLVAPSPWQINPAIWQGGLSQDDGVCDGGERASAGIWRGGRP